MAAAIKLAFGADPELVPSSGGIIEVTVDGVVLWTNDERRGYKPTDDEVVSALRSAGH